MGIAVNRTRCKVRQGVVLLPKHSIQCIQSCEATVVGVFPMVYVTRRRSAPYASSFFREVFGHLEDAERREVFREPLAEIVQMLEENLLNKFRSHVAMERGAVCTLVWRYNVSHAHSKGLTSRCHSMDPYHERWQNNVLKYFPTNHQNHLTLNISLTLHKRTALDVLAQCCPQKKRKRTRT